MSAARLNSTTDKQEARPLFHQGFKALPEQNRSDLLITFYTTEYWSKISTQTSDQKQVFGGQKFVIQTRRLES